MLSIKRKNGQKIHIGKDIIVKVAVVNSKTTKVMIEAPPNIKILREELSNEKY